MPIIQTVFPIFLVIFVGWLACKAGFFPRSFVGPANRLVYFISIPALLFRSIAGSSFFVFFNPTVLGATLAALLATFLLVWVVTGRGIRTLGVHRGSFIQCCVHGNLGHIGLAVAFYALGPEGFTHAGILSGFVMITHNVMSVVALSVFAPDRSASKPSRWELVGRIVKNPVIATCMAGILYSLSGWPLPPMVDRVLAILGGMALPMALLLIGSSLSFKGFSDHLPALILGTGVKLLLLPAFGFFLYRLAGLASDQFLPGLVLLAAPTATVVYVMALEMKGQPELAVSFISFSTLVSLFSYAFWLHVV